MLFSVLAVSFLVLVGFVVFIGYQTVFRRAGGVKEDVPTEKCTICRERIAKELLVERQIGDYKLLYFCRKCIVELYSGLGPGA